MVGALVYVVILCAITALVYWAVDALGTPQPINKVVKVAVVVIAVLIIIGLVANLFGIATGIPVPRA